MKNYYQNDTAANFALASARGEFIRKTYLNLAVALGVFVLLLAGLCSFSPAVELATLMVSSGNAWLIVLGAFMLVSWIANKWAFTATSLAKQYAGLYLYVVAEAFIFLPLVVFAQHYAPDAIPQAAILTGALVLGLTAVVFVTGTDFSFLRSILVITSFIALGLIVCSLLFGFQLGTWFSLAMIVFAASAVLYQTSAIARDYRENQHVAAALGLFAAIALLFWYILQLLMSRR